jgi:hypothetical protein
MANTFIKIASVTVGSGGAATIEFTSIPSTYTDLCLVTSIREASTDSYTATIKFNSSGSSYSQRNVQGSGSSVSSASPTDIEMMINGSSSTSNTFSNSSVYISNYTGSANKSVSVDSVTEANVTLAFARLGANLWSNTAAITSISIQTTTGNLAQHSTATLYGIKNS